MGAKAIERLRGDMVLVKHWVADEPLAKLLKVGIWLELDSTNGPHGRTPVFHYHSYRGWLKKMDFHPGKHKCVEYSRAASLVQNRRGGYLPVDEKHFVRGHVIAHADGFGFLVPDEGGDDLFLSGKQMRGVLHGDHAVATVAGVDRRGRREGSIVSVVERANTTRIGRWFDVAGIAYVVPDNKRITQNILMMN